MATKKTLINFIVDDPLLKRVEDFRFKNRFPTRAAAIKWLLDWAIKQKPSAKGQAELEPEQEEALPAEDHSAGANAQESRAAAMNALQDLVQKQRPAETGAALSPLEPPPLNQVLPTEAASAPKPESVSSRESITQALRDQGYEVGDVVRHPDGQQRILVRSQDRSAWVNVAQELEDLAAARITIAEVADRRRAAGR